MGRFRELIFLMVICAQSSPTEAAVYWNSSPSKNCLLALKDLKRSHLRLQTKKTFVEPVQIDWDAPIEEVERIRDSGRVLSAPSRSVYYSPLNFSSRRLVFQSAPSEIFFTTPHRDRIKSFTLFFGGTVVGTAGILRYVNNRAPLELLFILVKRSRILELQLRDPQTGRLKKTIRLDHADFSPLDQNLYLLARANDRRQVLLVTHPESGIIQPFRIQESGRIEVMEPIDVQGRILVGIDFGTGQSSAPASSNRRSDHKRFFGPEILEDGASIKFNVAPASQNAAFYPDNETINQFLLWEVSLSSE